jgi:hypothetical protein
VALERANNQGRRLSTISGKLPPEMSLIRDNTHTARDGRFTADPVSCAPRNAAALGAFAIPSLIVGHRASIDLRHRGETTGTPGYFPRLATWLVRATACVESGSAVVVCQRLLQKDDVRQSPERRLRHGRSMWARRSRSSRLVGCLAQQSRNRFVVVACRSRLRQQNTCSPAEPAAKSTKYCCSNRRPEWLHPVDVRACRRNCHVDAGAVRLGRPRQASIWNRPFCTFSKFLPEHLLRCSRRMQTVFRSRLRPELPSR